MAITFNTPVQIGNNLFRVTWSSTLSPSTYRARVDFGDEVVLTAATIDIAGGQVLEVLDTTTGAFLEPVPGWLELGWNRDSDALQYRIEQYNGSAWVAIATIQPSSTEAWVTYRTDILTDESTAQWRVTPIDAAGNDGTLVSFSVLIVRYPDAPAPTMTYSAVTNKVTVS